VKENEVGVGIAGAKLRVRRRINGTHSEPVGIYWAISKAPSEGDFVFALPPAKPISKLAKERTFVGRTPNRDTGTAQLGPATPLPNVCRDSLSL